MENLNYDEEIYNLLINPYKINKVSYFDITFKNNSDYVFNYIMKNNVSEIEVEACSFLLGKACEMVILHALKPNVERVWLAPEQMEETFVTNLPEHLHVAVLDVMDGCEKALERYMMNHEFDLKKTMIDIQYIAEMITDKHKIYDVRVERFGNREICFPSELFTLVNNYVLKEFEKEGYKIEALTNNFNSACSVVLSKDNERMMVYEGITVSPNKARYQEYIRKELKLLAQKEGCKAYVVGIMVESADPKAKELSIIPYRGSMSVRRTQFIEI